MQPFYKFITWLLYRSTCLGRLHAHHQELTTALTASGFTYCHKTYLLWQPVSPTTYSSFTALNMAAAGSTEISISYY
jgi:hypothetical protein